MKELQHIKESQLTLQYHDEAITPYSDLGQLLEELGKGMTVIKDGKGAFVANVRMQGKDCIFKIPRGRNRNAWERFSTLFRQPDVLRFLRWRLVLKDLGLTAPKPLVTGVVRQFGLATLTFIVYEKVPGKVGETETEIAAISDALARVHRAGYLRRDAHLRNFLIMPDEKVCIIDYRLSRPLLFPTAQKGVECEKLIKFAPSAANYIDRSYLNSVGFKAMEFRRFLKQKLKWLSKLFKPKRN
ncbi:hypothetical protein E4656_02290 [Natronospirillum operosum]|uniref:Heptose kinase n=1 Tax=Natronospirillum operosum TaxID=2759953 RepID=A0A4Z0WE28_9GAMM|nr:hypothetical protein [Natronospirillum operosum]TGG95270.1 hypothetical protein E4656_02290 [Natronospirillum operosum]